jgi:MFS transporter, PAT family, beta-lactamase induction signal transducer AmpG
MNKALRYTLYALLYFVQGTVLSYFTALNPIYLRNHGLSMSQVGLIGTIGMLPFVIKIFFGMLSDRVNLLKMGHRKPYIIIGLLIQAAALLIAPLINPGTHYIFFALLAFLLMTGMALFDTCTDGLALDSTPQEDTGTVQGLMVGGRALGVVIVSGALGFIVQKIGWSAVFWAMAVLTLLPLPFTLTIHEQPRPANTRFEWKAFRAFSAWPIIALALLGALYSFTINGADQIMIPFLNENFGVNELSAGFYVSVWGIGVVLGGISGGRLVDRLGVRRATLTAALLALIAIGGLALITGAGIAWLLIPAFGLAYGYYETVYFATSMQRSDRRIAASMFSILMAIANIGTGIGLGVTGVLVDAVDYRLTFAILAAINLLALPLIPAIFPPKQITDAHD